ncbi:MAG: (2Fe-2S)-binding protein [Bacillota bacterium]
MRIIDHPILGREPEGELISFTYDGKAYKGKRGEMIAAALLANNIRIHRYTSKLKEPRGVFCGIGQCTDCIMVVNGVPNVRTCITPLEDGMVIETQFGTGRRSDAGV